MSYLPKNYSKMLIDKKYNEFIIRQIVKTIIFIFIIEIMCDLAYAYKTNLQNIVLDSDNGNLIVSFELENVFSSQMKEVILNGIPITFTYLVVLNEIRNFWLDKRIVNLKIDHMMKYNVLKKEFVIKRSWQIDEVLITGSFDEAQSLMTKISGLKIIPFNWLDNGRRYQIGVKSELSKANLPINLRSALFFSPTWGFETDWYVLDFSH